MIEQMNITHGGLIKEDLRLLHRHEDIGLISSNHGAKIIINFLVQKMQVFIPVVSMDDQDHHKLRQIAVHNRVNWL
jgi:hypothetical protein